MKIVITTGRTVVGLVDQLLLLLKVFSQLGHGKLYKFCKKKCKAGGVNDPLGQPTARPPIKICFALLDLEKNGRMDRWTDKCEHSDHH